MCEAGAQGTVLKTGRRDDLLGTLRSVVGGSLRFDARHPERPKASLSPRERQVLKLIAAGATNTQIADTLGVTVETVKTLVRRSYAKLGVGRRAEAVSTAYKLGLL